MALNLKLLNSCFIHSFVNPNLISARKHSSVVMPRAPHNSNDMELDMNSASYPTPNDSFGGYSHFSGVLQPSSKNRYCTQMGLFFKEENLGIQHPCSFPLWPGRTPLKKQRANGLRPDTSMNQKTIELLDAQEDDYDGILIDPDCLPLSSNAFVAALRTSISAWKQKGKKGVWLKILAEQADLVPIAIKEGFRYHHAEPGYAMLTYWIPNGPCMLPSNASHQVGVGGFVINDKKEVLVVKEKQCPCQCSGIWKFPTGFINQSEELFTGAVREVKEETGIDTAFVEVIAFRHAHQAAFEKSDLLFICMLKPLSFEISIDESEIEAAKWMPLDEFLRQPFYQDDCMSKKVIDMCVANYENRFKGLTAHHVISKLDGNLSYLYYSSNGTEKD